MKIRAGFVSNSSSSSYTCNVCGFSEEGWDSPDGFLYCESGHGLCHDCNDINDKTISEVSKLSPEKIVEKLGFSGNYGDELCNDLRNAKSEKDLNDIVHDAIMYDELSSGFCPVCQFEVISEYDMKQYLVKVSKITTDEVFQKIKMVNKRRKKLYNHEYVSYVCGELGVNTIEFSEEIKSKFSNYDDFRSFIK